ncbi:MAG: hypothetical protein ABII90_02180, partial [Bacteroidota bacterium]
MIEEEKRLVEELRIAFSKDISELEVSFLADFYSYFKDYLLNTLSIDDYKYFILKFDKFKSVWNKYAFNSSIDELAEDFNLLNEYYESNCKRNYSFLKNIPEISQNIHFQEIPENKNNNISTQPQMSLQGASTTKQSSMSLRGASATKQSQPLNTNFSNLNKTLSEVLKNSKIVVIVTGGFHSEGLKSLLQDKKISYLTITPNVIQDTSISNSIYSTLAKKQAKLFGSQALALALGSTDAKVISVTKEKITLEIDGEIITLLRNQVKNKFTLSQKLQKTINIANKTLDKTAIELAVNDALTITEKILSFTNPLMTSELIYQLVKLFSHWSSSKGIFGGTGLIWSIASDPKVQEVITKRENISVEELNQLSDYFQEVIKTHALNQERINEISKKSALIAAIINVPGMQAFINSLATLKEKADTYEGLARFNLQNSDKTKLRLTSTEELIEDSRKGQAVGLAGWFVKNFGEIGASIVEELGIETHNKNIRQVSRLSDSNNKKGPLKVFIQGRLLPVMSFAVSFVLTHYFGFDARLLIPLAIVIAGWIKGQSMFVKGHRNITIKQTITRTIGTIILNAVSISSAFLLINTFIPPDFNLVSCIIGTVAILIGTIAGVITHTIWNLIMPENVRLIIKKAEEFAFKPEKKRNLSKISPEQKKLNDEVFEKLGFHDKAGKDKYTQFQKFTNALEFFDRWLPENFLNAAQHIFSMRTSERFSKAVLSITDILRDKKIENPFIQATLFVFYQYYFDLCGITNIEDIYFNNGYFKDLIQTHRLDPKVLKILLNVDNIKLDFEIEQLIARALATNEPVLFEEQPGSDLQFMRALKSVTGKINAKVDIMWAHPFTDESQIIGHKVQKKGEKKLVLGYGELMWTIIEAQNEIEKAKLENRPPRKHILLIKNVEAIDSEVRSQLQELLRVRETNHRDFGLVKLPDNFQIMFTKASSANLEDDSFYDRVISKTVSPQDYPGPHPLEIPFFIEVNETNFTNYIHLEAKDNKLFLVIDKYGISPLRIPLSKSKFKGIDVRLSGEELVYEIYNRTGLVIDFDTICMLCAMQFAVNDKMTVLRIEGPTGVGKTYTASKFAALRGSSFVSQPTSEGSHLSDLIGGFEQDEDGNLRFNGETSVKEQLEKGGVVALSELNTLLDTNEKASIAWWLVQIAEAEPDKDGYKTIYLTEVPTEKGKERYSIRIHPESLIVVDTNPEGDYTQRGAFPDIFKKYVQRLTVSPFISGKKEKENSEKTKLKRYTELFLRNDIVIDSKIKAKGIADKDLCKELSDQISNIYWSVVSEYINGKFGTGETSIFSARELKRICEDVLYELEKGVDKDKALLQAIRNHLIYCWPNDSDRNVVATLHLDKMLPQPKSDKSFLNQSLANKKLSDIIDINSEISLGDIRNKIALLKGLNNKLINTIGLDEFISDQVLNKKRPVNIRISPETNLHAELESFRANHPDVKMKIIPCTAQTDRFILEGGKVPTPDGKSTKFEDGILGRLSKEAKNNPGKQFIYFMENAHNLRAEEAVSLNEVQQTRTYHPRGRKEEIQLPGNAHFIIVTRKALPWSPAEQSRYTTIAYKQDFNKYGNQLIKKVLFPVLSEKRNFPKELFTYLENMIFKAYSDFEKDISDSQKYNVRLSNRKFERYINSIKKHIENIPEGKLDHKTIYTIAEELFNDIFLEGLNPESQKNKYWELKEKFIQAHSWKEISGQQVSDNPEAQLAKAEVDFLNASNAKDIAEKEKAIEKINKVLSENSDSWNWETMEKENLKTGDVGKGMIPSMIMESTQDMKIRANGNIIVRRDEQGIAYIIIRNTNGTWQEEKELGDAYNGIEISADGSVVVLVDKNSIAHIIYQVENKIWQKEEFGDAYKKIILSEDGNLVIRVNRFGKTYMKSCIDKKEWQEEKQIGDASNGFARSQDGKVIVRIDINGIGYMIHCDDQNNWQKEEEIGEAYQTYISNDNRVIVRIDLDRIVHLRYRNDQNNWQEEKQIGDASNGFEMSENGKVIVRIDTNGIGYMIHCDNQNNWQEKKIGDAYYGFEMSENGKVIVRIDTNRIGYMIHCDNQNNWQEKKIGDAYYGIKISQDGKFIARMDTKEKIYVIHGDNQNNWQEEKELVDFSLDLLQSMKINVSANNNVVVWRDGR